MACVQTANRTAQEVLVQYKAELVDDVIVHTHLSALYDSLLEQNLVRGTGAVGGGRLEERMLRLRRPRAGLRGGTVWCAWWCVGG